VWESWHLTLFAKDPQGNLDRLSKEKGGNVNGENKETILTPQKDFRAPIY